MDPRAPEPMPTIETRIKPAPVETVIDVVVDKEVPGGAVVLFIHTPSGIAIAYLDPAVARTVADHMKSAANRAGSGLHIAGNGAIPPPPLRL